GLIAHLPAGSAEHVGDVASGGVEISQVPVAARGKALGEGPNVSLEPHRVRSAPARRPPARQYRLRDVRAGGGEQSQNDERIPRKAAHFRSPSTRRDARSAACTGSG